MEVMGMYTWGHVKQAALAKLDLTAEEASDIGLLNRFPIYANEAMTNICSTVKPNRTFAEFTIDTENTIKTMPTDFISFGDDVCTRTYVDEYGETCTDMECHDDDITYIGYNKIKFLKTGTYNISYNARWYVFNVGISEFEVLDIPDDVVECLASYIASQCYKMDDEVKASMYRNEYEMFVARIDATDFKNTKTFKIGGGW